MDTDELIAALDEEIDRLLQVKKLLFNGASFQTRQKLKQKSKMSAEGRARISFRDALANSPRFVETGDAEATDSKGNTSYFLKAMAISIDDNANKNGISTAIAETLLIGNSTYITTTIQVCGRETVVSCAARMLSKIDEISHAK